MARSVATISATRWPSAGVEPAGVSAFADVSAGVDFDDTDWGSALVAFDLRTQLRNIENDLVTQAEFLGYDFRTPAEKEQLIVLQYRLDFAHNYTRLADPPKLLEELRSLTGDRRPSRFVIDSVAPFMSSGGMHDTVDGLLRLLEGVDATTYITVTGDPAADDAPRRVDQAQDREAGHGLAAARLAHEA